MYKKILSAIILVLACACTEEKVKSGPLFEKTVGKEVVEVIIGTDAVKATKISNNKKIQLTDEQLTKFRKLILSDSSYIFDKKKRCVFVPQMSYVFKDVTILVSHTCNQIKITAPSKKSVIIDYDHVAKELNNFSENIIKE